MSEFEVEIEFEIILMNTSLEPPEMLAALMDTKYLCACLRKI